jgi:UDP-N-acetylmuramyl tripeptide synthase
MRVFLVIAILVLVVGEMAGCSEQVRYDALVQRSGALDKQSAEASPQAAVSTALASTAASPAPVEPVAAVEPRQVIYTGTFAVLVPDVGSAIEAARRLAEAMGGYVQQQTMSDIVFRVPAARFNEAAEALKVFGTVADKHIDAQDVTEEYADLDLRLKSARALLDKLVVLLAKAENVKDALEVEREVARVRAEIEKLEAQKNRLSNRVAYATLTVRFSPMKEAPRGLKTSLPFPWLNRLGLEHLMDAFGM